MHVCVERMWWPPFLLLVATEKQIRWLNVRYKLEVLRNPAVALLIASAGLDPCVSSCTDVAHDRHAGVQASTIGVVVVGSMLVVAVVGIVVRVRW